MAVLVLPVAFAVVPGAAASLLFRCVHSYSSFLFSILLLFPMTSAPADWDTYCNPPLARFLRLTGRDLRFAAGEGCTLLERDGRRFQDWVAGFGALPFGHRPAAIADALRAALDDPRPGLIVEGANPQAGALARELVAAAGPGYETAYLTSSGAEAVEAALKTALAATGRPRLACAAGGFHGTTLGALACTAPGAFRDPFRSALPPVEVVPWGDLDALRSTLASGEIAGFLLEPLQVEAGVREAPPGWLSGAQALCREHGALLLLDEVQTGLGRTGALFAMHGLNGEAPLEPDVLILAKALGGGLVPSAAAVMRRGVWERAFGDPLRCEAQASTYGGNALACAAGRAALAAVQAPGFLDGVRARGAALRAALEARLAACGALERGAEVRGAGLLLGVALPEPRHPWLSWDSLGLPELTGRPVSGPLVVQRLLRAGLLTQICGHDWRVLRLEPPLIVDEPACAALVGALGEAVEWLIAEGGCE